MEEGLAEGRRVGLKLRRGMGSEKKCMIINERMDCASERAIRLPSCNLRSEM